MPSTFPTGFITSLPVSVEREWPSLEFRAASGRTTSTSYQSAPVRRYSYTFPILRTNVSASAPWNAYSEYGALLAAYAQCTGTLRTITLSPDPEGNSVSVKFEAAPAVQKIADVAYSAQVDLVEAL